MKLGKWPARLLAAAAGAAVLAVVYHLLRLNGLDNTEKYVSVAAGLLSIITLLSLGLRNLGADRDHAPTPGTTPADESPVERLALAVRRQWESEAAARGLHDPRPLPVRWQAAPDELADRTRDVPDESHDATVGDVVRAADYYLSTPSRRLAVLGQPGSGKSVLTVVLTLQILERRTQHDPVPVIVPITHWDPRRTSLYDWLADFVASNYPIEDSRPASLATAHKLITNRQLIPVLDGLDEMPPALQKLALNRLNRGMSANDPLVLTCRRDDYERIVQAGDALTNADVVALQPLELSQVKSYLVATTSAMQSGKWSTVFDHLDAEPLGPLAGTLRSPLMVYLARTIYSDTLADPGALLAPGMDSEQHIGNHLLDGLLPATYADGYDQLADFNTDDVRHADKVERWLTFLAVHLQRTGTADIAWWELPRANLSLLKDFFYAATTSMMVGVIFGAWPAAGFAATYLTLYAFGALPAVTVEHLIGRWPGRRSRALRNPHVIGVSVCRVIAISFGLFIALPDAANHSLAETFGRIGLTALAFGMAMELFTFNAQRRPSAAVTRNRRSIGRFVRAAGLGLLIFALLGVLTLPFFDAVQIIAVEATFGLVFGLILGFGAFSAPAKVEAAMSPDALLRADRQVALSGFVLAFIFGGLVAGAAGAALSGPAYGISMSLVFGIGYALGDRFAGLAASSWFQYRMAHALLALGGDLPWRLLSFLDEAHRVGVLRRVGAVYQFRHSRLAERLANRDTSEAQRHGRLAEPALKI